MTFANCLEAFPRCPWNVRRGIRRGPRRFRSHAIQPAQIALDRIEVRCGPHPVALLAHGNVGSKEMLFRFGEALAAAPLALLAVGAGDLDGESSGFAVRARRIHSGTPTKSAIGLCDFPDARLMTSPTNALQIESSLL